ncbi:MAG TPA: hypothetical protein VF443_13430 [Nitrospira sp.]
MPRYGTPQSGPFADSTKNLTALQPRDSLKLFDNEMVAMDETSIAFNRGFPPTGDDVGVTFAVVWSAAPTAAIDIQAAACDIDSEYQTIMTLQNKQVDGWTDKEFWQYYRVKCTSYVAGGAVTVTAQL